MLINRYKEQLKAKQKETETQEQAVGALEEMNVPELKELAKEKGIDGYSNMKKQELIEALEAGE